jgi:hypothetical protein
VSSIEGEVKPIGRDRFPFALEHVRMADGEKGWRDILAGGRALPVPSGLAVAPSLPATDDLKGLRR